MDMQRHRAQMFVNDSELLQGLASALIKYFRQLEKHLAENGTTKDLEKIASTPGLGKQVKELENKILGIKNANMTERALIYSTCTDLNYNKKQFEKIFSDFEVDYSK